MIDIHSHIIPKIDDGSDCVASSIEMLKEAEAFGITDIIATPHYCPNRGYVKSASDIIFAFEELQTEAKKANIPLNLYLGEEIYCSDYDDIVSKLDSGELLTLNGTEYVLLEYGVKMAPKNLLENIYNLNVHGYKPIIAHIERYSWMSFDMAYALKDEGCILQVNASSFGTIKYKRLCKQLQKNGLIDIVASDIHNGRKDCYKNIDVIKCDKALEDELLSK